MARIRPISLAGRRRFARMEVPACFPPMRGAMIPLKTLMQYCRKLPHATEDVKWEKDLVFSVGGKMFAVFDQDEMLQLSFKAPAEEFNRLTKLPHIIPAP